MGSQFLAEIRMFGGSFAPPGWAACDGQLLPVQQNPGLFAILGTRYGGDGARSFGLPDLRGRAPLHAGQGAGLSHYDAGQRAGAATATLTTATLPRHRHALIGDGNPGEMKQIGDNLFGAGPSFGRPLYSTTATTPCTMSPAMIASSGPGWSGSAQPFSTMQPYLALTFIIALQGTYPVQAEAE